MQYWCLGGKQVRQQLAQQLPELTQQAIEKVQTQTQHPVRQQFFDLPFHHVRLHAITAGPVNGPLCVLLHGFPECWWSYRDIIPALANQGFFVVAVDMRGYGLSHVATSERRLQDIQAGPLSLGHYSPKYVTQDIVHLITTVLKKPHATVIAHDWGGAIAWNLALTHPEVVNKLVIMDAPHPHLFGPVIRRDWTQAFRSWYFIMFQFFGLPETLFLANPLKFVKTMFAEVKRPGACQDFDQRMYAAVWSTPGSLNAAFNYYRAMFHVDLVGRKLLSCLSTSVSAFFARAWLGLTLSELGLGIHRNEKKSDAKRTNMSTLKMPLLLLWGEKDSALSPAFVEVMNDKHAANVTKQVFKASHWLPVDAAPQVIEALEIFLK